MESPRHLPSPFFYRFIPDCPAGWIELVLCLLPLLMVAACAESSPITEPGDISGRAGISAVGYACVRADGNRLAGGKGAAPGQPLEIATGASVRWIAAAAIGRNESIWAVVSDNGTVTAYRLADAGLTSIRIEPVTVSPDHPPLLIVDTLGAAWLPSPMGAAPYAGMAMTGRGLIYISGNSELFLERPGTTPQLLAENILTDARPIVTGDETILVLTDPTNRYAHGVLGDAIEAGGMTALSPFGMRIFHTEIADPAVIEGQAPLAADLTGDALPEFIVTESDVTAGARLVVYDRTGERRAAGDAVGLGYRWRHQLAAGPFGPGGEMEIASILTPHIGGVVEFHRLVDDTLQIAARLPGYSSHVSGSRNLDMAVAGDFDGDGGIELVVPVQNRTRLEGIRRTASGVEVVWSLNLPAPLSSNLTAVTLSDGTLLLGAGCEDGTVLIGGGD